MTLAVPAVPLPSAEALAVSGNAQSVPLTSGQLLGSPPLPPPSLLDGFPDPDRVEARKKEYLKSLQEQVRQRVQTLTQKHQANLEYLRAKNDQCKRQAHATIDQELLKQEMEIDRRHDEQLLALQQAAMRRKFNISKEAGELTLQYQTKETQEKLQMLDYELHRKYFDVASGQIDWRQQVDATRSSLPDPPGPPPAEKPPLLSPGTLFLAVQAAYNLTNTDTGLLGDVSDPYVVVRLGGQEFTTPVISNNLNPVWEADNRFTLTVTEEDKLLELEVKNSNHFRDDSLGRTSLDFRSLTPNAWHSHKDLLKDGDKGELEYAVHFKPAAASSLKE
ncbi:unnamed protein product [Durusdinium trenchii]|uniref:Protein C2-DOMAIN ABA-RELATED 9 n=2 Tax=Durusdinium trenchii TaxID=1381693 RepID=A0ABP0ICB9_9DINO